MYYYVNISTFIIALLYSICSLQFIEIFIFLREYQQIKWDLFCLSFLNAIGQLVIYQMIRSFKQHIPSFVIATRKCFTVIINILYFHHSINFLQIIGIITVFFAIMFEVYDNYQLNLKKDTQDTQDRNSFKGESISQDNNEDIIEPSNETTSLSNFQ